MSNNKQTMKLYTESEVRKAIELARDTHQEGRAYMERDEYDYSMDEVFDLLTPIVLPSDEEIESRYNKFIDTEIQLGFLKQEQGERLKWYYKTYFIDKIQGGNNE